MSGGNAVRFGGANSVAGIGARGGNGAAPPDILAAISARVKKRYDELQKSSYISSGELLRVALDEKKKFEKTHGPSRVLPERDCELLHAVQTLEQRINIILRCVLAADQLLMQPEELETRVLQQLRRDKDFGDKYRDVTAFADVGLGRLAHWPLVCERFDHDPSVDGAVLLSGQDLLTSLLAVLTGLPNKRKVDGWSEVLEHVALSRGVPRDALCVPLKMPSLPHCIVLVSDARRAAEKERVNHVERLSAKLDREFKAEEEMKAEVRLGEMLKALEMREADPANWPAVSMPLTRALVQAIVAATLCPWAVQGRGAKTPTAAAMPLLQRCLGGAAIIKKLLALRGKSPREASITAADTLASTVYASLTAELKKSTDAWQVMGRFGIYLLACLVNSIADMHRNSTSAEAASSPLPSASLRNAPTAPLCASASDPVERFVEALAALNAAAPLSSAHSSPPPSKTPILLPPNRCPPLLSADGAPAASQGVAVLSPTVASRIADDALDALCSNPRVALLAALAQRVHAEASRAMPGLPILDDTALEQLLQKDETGTRVLAVLDDERLFFGGGSNGSIRHGNGSGSDGGGGDVGVSPSSALGRELAALVRCAASSTSSDVVGVATAERRLAVARAAAARHFALSEPADLNPFLADAAPGELPASIEERLARLAVTVEAAAGGITAASTDASDAVSVPFAALPGPPSLSATTLLACVGLPEPLVSLPALVPMLGEVEGALAWAEVYAPAGYGARFGDYLRKHGAACAAAGLRFVEGTRSRWYRLPRTSSVDEFRRAAARRDATSAAAAAAGLVCASAADSVDEDSAAAAGGSVYERIHTVLAAVCSSCGSAGGNAGGVDGVGCESSGDNDAMARFCVEALAALPPFLCGSLGGAVLLPVLLVDLQCGVQQLTHFALGDATARAALLAAAGALCASAGACDESRHAAQRLVLRLLAAPVAAVGEPAQPLALLQPLQHDAADNAAPATPVMPRSAAVVFTAAAPAVAMPSAAIPPANELTADEQLPPSLADARALVQFLERDYTDKPANDSARRAAEGATAKVAGDMYTLASHFLFELVQNADDATYLAGVDPELSFVVSGCGSGDGEGGGANSGSPLLSVRTNERGFRVKDMHAITSAGQSSKGGVAAAYGAATAASGQTGKKGIGWKSVFSVSRTPEVHSGYLHFVFDTQPPELGGLGQLGMLAPRWLEPANAEEERTPGSYIRLPLQATSQAARVIAAKYWPREQQLLPAAKVDDAVRALAMQPDIMLFLRRLVRLRLSAGAGTANAEEHLLERGEPAALSLPAASEAAGHDAALVSVQVSALLRPPTLLQWLVHSLTAALDVDGDGSAGESPKTRLSLAFPFSADMFAPPPGGEGPVKLLELPEQRLFSYLPVRSMGWRVIIQADWHLVSSREALKNDDDYNIALARSVLPRAFAGAVESFQELAAKLDFNPPPSALVICRAFLAFAPLQPPSLLSRGEERLLLDAAKRTCQLLRKTPCLPAATGNAYLCPVVALRAPLAIVRFVSTEGGGVGDAALASAASPGTVLMQLLAACGATAEAVEAATGMSLVHPRLALTEDHWASLDVRAWDLALAAEVLRHVVAATAPTTPPLPVDTRASRFLAWIELLNATARAHEARGQRKNLSTLLAGVPFVPLLDGQIVPLSTVAEARPLAGSADAIFFVSSKGSDSSKLLDLVRVLSAANLAVRVVDEPVTAALQELRWRWLSSFFVDLGMHELSLGAIVEHVVLPFFLAVGSDGGSRADDIAPRLAAAWAAVTDWYTAACGGSHTASTASAVLSRDDERLLTKLRQYAILRTTDGAIVPVPSSADAAPPLGLPLTALKPEAAVAATNLATALQGAGVPWRVADSTHWPVSDDSSRERAHSLLIRLGLSEGFAGVPLLPIAAARQAAGAVHGLRPPPPNLVPTAVISATHATGRSQQLTQYNAEDMRGANADSPSLDKTLASLREKRTAGGSEAAGAAADAALDAICVWTRPPQQSKARLAACCATQPGFHRCAEATAPRCWLRHALQQRLRLPSRRRCCARWYSRPRSATGVCLATLATTLQRRCCALVIAAAVAARICRRSRPLLLRGGSVLSQSRMRSW